MVFHTIRRFDLALRKCLGNAKQDTHVALGLGKELGRNLQNAMESKALLASLRRRH